jgi:D-psicose/D-tagatose/L-ribulose 3-epimerase
MLFGIHSLLFNETFIEKDLPLLDKCKKLGFDAVEIIPFDLDNFPARQVKQAASDLGLTMNMGYGMPVECNVISPNAATRKRGHDLSRRLIDASNEAGAVVFGGAIYCGWGYLSGKKRTQEEWQWGIEACRKAAEYAQETSDLVIGIEPLNRFESHFINVASDAVTFIKEVGMPNVKVHLDTFHMIREENNIGQAVRDAGAYLGYVHACENQRGVPGRGLIPWKEFFLALKEVGYDYCITIESFDPNMEAIAKLTCIWRQLADSPEHLATDGLRFLKDTYRKVYGESTA